MKKIISVFVSLMLLSSLASCGEKENTNTKTNDQFNEWSIVRMEDGVLFTNAGGFANVLDYETMEATLLCNNPNCSHTTSQCLALTLKDSNQLPVIYNNCAYYFTNSHTFADDDNGKRVLDLSTTIMKYDFDKMEFSKVQTLDGYNANSNGGRSYLIGSEYYFTTNNGGPEYDAAGNVTGSSNSGQAKLYCINLDTEDLIDYGEIFDYELYEKRGVARSAHTYLVGKSYDNVYLQVTTGNGTVFYDEIYAFNMKTNEITKVGNKPPICAGDGYLVYMKINGEYEYYDVTADNECILMIENIKTGEVIEGCEVEAYNGVTIYNKKIWYDSKCFDIETQKEEIVSELDCGRVIGVYDNHYILTGYDEDGQEIFEKVPCEEIDKLFE